MGFVLLQDGALFARQDAQKEAAGKVIIVMCEMEDTHTAKKGVRNVQAGR